jgi:hypothetical protein
VVGRFGSSRGSGRWSGAGWAVANGVATSTRMPHHRAAESSPWLEGGIDEAFHHRSSTALLESRPEPVYLKGHVSRWIIRYGKPHGYDRTKGALEHDHHGYHRCVTYPTTEANTTLLRLLVQALIAFVVRPPTDHLLGRDGDYSLHAWHRT